MKPMLAFQKRPDLSKLRFPVICSPKLDGFRALVYQGQLVSRNLITIPNLYTQRLFSLLPEGTDGELVVGEPVNEPFNRTSRGVTRADGTPDVRYYVFDNFAAKGGFEDRFRTLSKIANQERVVIVHHQVCNTIEEVIEFEAKCLAMGFEGAMIRKPDGPYKQGRSTENEGWLLKLKDRDDSEAEILGTFERMQNDNEATTDNLGHTKRSSHQENKHGHGDLGGFELRDIHTGIEFRCGTLRGFTLEDRKKLWQIRHELPGQFVKYLYFGTTKEKPRHPVCIGFRSKIDI